MATLGTISIFDSGMKMFNESLDLRICCCQMNRTALIQPNPDFKSHRFF